MEDRTEALLRAFAVGTVALTLVRACGGQTDERSSRTTPSGGATAEASADTSLGAAAGTTSGNADASLGGNAGASAMGAGGNTGAGGTLGEDDAGVGDSAASGGTGGRPGSGTGGIAGGPVAVPGSCLPAFCPAAFGTPCCMTSEGPCGVDFGMGCVSVSSGGTGGQDAPGPGGYAGWRWAY